MYKLNAYEKNEFRRLTQRANRRLKAFQVEYAKHGKSVIPQELTAGFNIQHTSQLNSANYAPSRSHTRFADKKEFNQYMKMLRRFESSRADSVPTVREYASINRSKLAQAFDTAGVKLTQDQIKKLSKMSSVEISKFWDEYYNKAKRLGIRYASDSVMEDMIDYLDSNKATLLKGALKRL